MSSLQRDRVANPLCVLYSEDLSTAGVETATEKGGGGRNFFVPYSAPSRGVWGHAQEIFGFWGPLEAIWCNLRRFYVKILRPEISSVE